MAKKSAGEKKTFEETLSELERKYGMGKPNITELTIVSTGSLQLNKAMGIGGTALGKIIELLGPESSGKSTITLHQIVEYQKAFPERRVALFDYENTFDLNYATVLGVDMNKLLIYQPDSQEAGYGMILDLVKTGMISCIVIDSQTAAAPKAMIDGDFGDATIALQARNNSKFCLMIKGLLTIYKTTLFIISQTRDNIGGMQQGEITTGGKAIKFYADARWKLWKQNDKINELNKTTIDVIKSKISNPFGQAKLNILWGVGFDVIGEILDYTLEFGIVKQSGSWFSYGDTKLGQGFEGVKVMLKDNPELLEELTDKVMNKLSVSTIITIEET